MFEVFLRTIILTCWLAFALAEPANQVPCGTLYCMFASRMPRRRATLDARHPVSWRRVADPHFCCPDRLSFAIPIRRQWTTRWPRTAFPRTCLVPLCAAITSSCPRHQTRRTATSIRSIPPSAPRQSRGTTLGASLSLSLSLSLPRCRCTCDESHTGRVAG